MDYTLLGSMERKPRPLGKGIARMFKNPKRSYRGSKQKRVMVYGSSCYGFVSTQSPRLAPRWVGDFAEGPESEIRGRSRAGPRVFAASNRV